MSGELEKIIPALSDAALLDMIESDPVFYLPEALALAHATIEARGGRTVLQTRVSDASHKFCWSCRAERPPTARFCPECGAPLKLQPQADAPAISPNNPESIAAAPSTDPAIPAGDALPSPDNDAKPKAVPENPTASADLPTAAQVAATEPEISEALTAVQGTATPDAAAGSPEIVAQPEGLSLAPADEAVPVNEPVAGNGANKAEAPSEVALPDRLPNATTDILPQPKAEPEPNLSPESAEPPPVEPPAAVAAVTGPEIVEASTPVQGTATPDAAVPPAHVTQPEDLSAVAAEVPFPEAAPGAKSISDELGSTMASSTTAPPAAPESPPSVSPPSPPPDATSTAVVPDVATATDPTPEDILASVMAASGQTEPEPVAPIESMLKAGAEATIAAVVLDAQSTSAADPPTNEGASEHAEHAVVSPDVVVVPSGDGPNPSKESPTDAGHLETQDAAAPVRPGPKLATPGRRQTKPKVVRALAAGGMLAALVAAGMLALPYWPGRSMSRPTVTVHARSRLTEPFQSALERCKSEYDASAGAVRRELTESIGVRGRETGGSLSVRLVRLRGKHGPRIVRAREALRQAEAALATIGESPGFPTSIAADFDKFSQILARNERFFSATASEAGFDQWYNDHPRMQAIYGRLQKAAARIDAEQAVPPSASRVSHEQP